jgi:leucyl aminopeptidase
MTKQVTLAFSKSAKPTSDTAVVFALDGGALTDHAAALDKKAGGIIASAVRVREGFKGKHGEVLSVILPKGAGFDQVLVVGLGAPEKLDVIGFENLGGKIFSALKSINADSASLLLNLPKNTKTSEADASAALAAGVRLRDYNFDKYKSKDLYGDRKKTKTLSHITIVTAASAKAQTLFKEEEALAQGVHLARDLVNEVANVLYPESYAAIIKKELGALGVQVEILDNKKMEKLGFGAHLAVGMGSIRPPRVVIMRWNGISGSTGGKGIKPSKTDVPIAFVGKGVTFDTGGISIKPAAGMEEMKMDMGGSAAVVGLIRALAARKAKVNVVGIVGLAENMPSDRSYRPGDIVKSLSGKTIEVLNTDAEGRLVLCDALTYIQRTDKPKMIVDLATLTGAIMVALGYEYAGAFVNDDKLWSQLSNASTASGEKLWRMPLDDAYREEMKSKVADLQNLGNLGRYGGACSAAGFLEHLLKEKRHGRILILRGQPGGSLINQPSPKVGQALAYACSTSW